MLRRISTDTLFMTVGVMLNKAGILAINILLARSSSTELYGQFALLRNTVNLIETTLSSSVNSIVIRASAMEYGNDYGFARTNSFLLVLGASVVIAISVPLWLFATPIASSLLNEPNPRLVHLGIVLLVATNISGQVTSFLVTGRATLHLPVASITAAAVAVLLAYAFIPGNPVFWAILSIVFLHGVEFLMKLAIAVCKRIISIRGIQRFHREVLSAFSASLVILITSSAVNAATFWLLRVMLVRINDNFTPLALFDVSFQYLAVEMMVLNNVVTIVQSRAANLIGRDPTALRRAFASGILLVASVAVGASAVNVMFANFLIGLYGHSYEPQMLRLLTGVLPLYAGAVFMNRSFVTIGRSGILLLVSVVSSTVTLIYAHFMMTDAYQLATAFIIYFAVSNIVFLATIAQSRLRAAKSQ